MKSTISNNRFYYAIRLSAGFRMLMAGLVIFSFAIAPLAQPPIQKPSSLPTLPLKPSGFSTAVTKTKNHNLSVTPTKLADIGHPASVGGTGTIKLAGALVNASGCCARIKVELLRFKSGTMSVFKEQTFEFCGTQAVSLSDNLNASEDDAAFLAKITNLDAWNKVTVNGALTLTYPTADRILAPQPNIPVDLTRGVDVTRTFTLSPNTAGKMKIEIRWNSPALLQARLFKPGQQPGAANNGVLIQNGSSASMDLAYDIQPADITAGTQWAINILNNSPSSMTATAITFKVIYTVNE